MSNHMPRSILIGIIQPRLEETFELVRARLEASGFDKIAGRRVVLTGGASQLRGVRELAALVLDKQVRMGRPIRRPWTGRRDRRPGLRDRRRSPRLRACKPNAEAPRPARRQRSPTAFGRFGTGSENF